MTEAALGRPRKLFAAHRFTSTPAVRCRKNPLLVQMGTNALKDSGVEAYTGRCSSLLPSLSF